MAKRKARASEIAPKIHLPTITPKTENHKQYIISIAENDITLCLGLPGTGKSFLSIGLACEHLLEGKTENIVLSRPFVVSGTGLGYLPGDLHEKMMPHLASANEYFKYFLGPHYQNMMLRGKIKFMPLEYMRGATFNDSYMLLEEAQNCTKEQLLMFLTRLGSRSKCIISGDEVQTDLKNTGIRTVVNRLDGLEKTGFIEMGPQDIMRHDLIGKIVQRLSW